jgi:uncharacterized protein
MPKLVNMTTGSVIAENVERANGLWRRMVGLIPCGQIGPEDGMWFDNCSAIHTIAMRERIDVVFLDAGNRVLRIDHSVRSFRFVVLCPGARTVVELGEARTKIRDLLAGDRLALS